MAADESETLQVARAALRRGALPRPAKRSCRQRSGLGCVALRSSRRLEAPAGATSAALGPRGGRFQPWSIICGKCNTSGAPSIAATNERSSWHISQKPIRSTKHWYSGVLCTQARAGAAWSGGGGPSRLHAELRATFISADPVGLGGNKGKSSGYDRSSANQPPGRGLWGGCCCSAEYVRRQPRGTSGGSTATRLGNCTPALAWGSHQAGEADLPAQLRDLPSLCE
mmetsp:Transcript_58128/g.109539  ORF Transcript_58128/g.109539 Transcript_58128/m.109539 type:complete len:226 (-) Transcript_58128:4-681(-)